MAIAVIILTVVVAYLLCCSIMGNVRVFELKDHIEQQKKRAGRLEEEVAFLRSVLNEIINTRT